MKRNKFSLSNYKLASLDMGKLVPVGWFEVLPGDTIQQVSSALVRASPLVSPVMHPLDIRIHHWYVPYRLIWQDFEKFITGGPDGLDASVYPTITFASGVVGGELYDYLGVPPLVANTVVSALPARAYDLIWNHWYRDQDLQTALVISTASGNDTTSARSLQSIGWEKDYFTSARPWEQKGATINVPLGTSATVKTSSSTLVTGAQQSMKMARADTGGTPNLNRVIGTGAGGNELTTYTTPGPTTAEHNLYPNNLYADLTGASAITVTALRQAMALQRYQEARARYGSRYVEYLRYLGVRSSDARLQLPEYCGGGKNVVQFSEVLQTGPSATVDQQNVVGALKGHGISAMRSNRYRRFIEEHGMIMSLMSIRPKTMYMNGLERKFNRRVKEDFWQKELEHIGQMPIKKKEIYMASADPDGTFGYQDRYDDYRRQESTVAGEMRNILNYWHMARDFGSEPALNASFVACVPTLRNFASSITDPFYVMCNHSIQARRMLSKTGSSFIF